jgi:thiosulfate/3-mercaptopyruvate sulfurtransferase
MTTPTTRAITLPEFQKRLEDPLTTIVDTRPVAAYNGWRIESELRGGHLPGAVSLPADWLPLLIADDLSELLAAKGLSPDRPVVVYGRQSALLAAALQERGYGVLSFDAWADWAADDRLPLEWLPNYEKLVHPEWLGQLLAGERPETFRGERYLVFHVNFGVPEEYHESHVPGSFYLDTNWLESSDDWNRRTPAQLKSRLARLGISSDTTVILYGRDTEGNPQEKWPGRRAGQIAATRAASILRYAGVDDVRLLDGGYDHWVKAGYPLESETHRPIPTSRFGRLIPHRPDLIIDLEEAKQILADREGAALVSVRSWKEHIGRVSGYNYIEPRGRIAGDVWGNCGSDAYHMQHYRNVDNTMRPYPEIAANWAQAGITPDKWVAFYCGTGWRASETWFYAYLMGWERIAVYDGGWFEWSQDPSSNPVEIGEPALEATTVAGNAAS